MHHIREAWRKLATESTTLRVGDEVWVLWGNKRVQGMVIEINGDSAVVDIPGGPKGRLVTKKLTDLAKTTTKTATGLKVVKLKDASEYFVDRSAIERTRGQYGVVDDNGTVRAWIRAEDKVTYMSNPGWMITVYTKEGMVGLGRPYDNKAPKGDAFANTLAEAKVKAVENVIRFDEGRLS